MKKDEKRKIKIKRSTSQNQSTLKYLEFVFNADIYVAFGIIARFIYSIEYKWESYDQLVQ